MAKIHLSHERVGLAPGLLQIPRVAVVAEKRGLEEVGGNQCRLQVHVTVDRGHGRRFGERDVAFPTCWVVNSLPSSRDVGQWIP